VERCEVCGFVWETVDRHDVGPRVAAGCVEIEDMLAGDSELLGARPAPERWSATEYAAHVRDVLITLRDRMVIGLVEDDPSFKPMYRDERIDLGLYRADTPGSVADELRAARAMFVRLFDAIDPDQLDRPVEYPWPHPTRRSLLWMGQQAVHEVEHHRSDIASNLASVGDP
jgi:DinB family protein